MPQGGIVVQESYPVMLGNEPIGTVQVRQSGLYVCFSCRCRLSGDQICTLELRRGAQREKLGVLVPEGSVFTLNTRLPAKRIGTEEASFHVVPKRAEMRGQFAPIYPDEPFAYLARLKDAYLARREGVVGAVLPPQDS